MSSGGTKCAPAKRRVPMCAHVMSDLILRRSLRFTIVVTTTVIAATGLILSYRGLFELITAQWETAGFNLGWGLSAGAAALLLIRYRGDLIDD